jgi:hypothetical protein
MTGTMEHSLAGVGVSVKDITWYGITGEVPSLKIDQKIPRKFTENSRKILTLMRVSIRSIM